MKRTGIAARIGRATEMLPYHHKLSVVILPIIESVGARFLAQTLFAELLHLIIVCFVIDP